VRVVILYVYRNPPPGSIPQRRPAAGEDRHDARRGPVPAGEGGGASAGAQRHRRARGSARALPRRRGGQVTLLEVAHRWCRCTCGRLGCHSWRLRTPRLTGSPASGDSPRPIP